MFFCLLFCSCELGGECWPNTDDSTSAGYKGQLVESKEQLSDGGQPTLRISKERLSQSKASASQRKERSIHPGTEFSECSGNRSEEVSQGEVILVVAPKQMPASLIRSSSLTLRDEPLVSDLTDDQAESSHWLEPDEAAHFLPTFTNQRPPHVASRNASFSNTSKQRYRT